MAGVKREVWTGEVVRQFAHSGEFLQEIPDQSRYVDNDVIHLVDLGVKPDVLVNNTTYPIPIQDIEDDDISISLDKFVTKQTEVSDDDLYAASFDIIGEKSQSHAESLEESTGDKAAHALAPQADDVKTPIVVTTGNANDEGHKALLPADLVTLKKKLDKAGVPKKGRVLVLSAEHVADLLAVSEAFAKQYVDLQNGKVLNLFGFKIYEHANCPKYYLSVGKWKKRAWGQDQAGDREASFAFYPRRMFKARGSVKFYLSEAKNNPGTQSNFFNYRLRFICLPKTQEAIAAVVSPDAA